MSSAVAMVVGTVVGFGGFAGLGFLTFFMRPTIGSWITLAVGAGAEAGGAAGCRAWRGVFGSLLSVVSFLMAFPDVVPRFDVPLDPADGKVEEAARMSLWDFNGWDEMLVLRDKGVDDTPGLEAVIIGVPPEEEEAGSGFGVLD